LIQRNWLRRSGSHSVETLVLRSRHGRMVVSLRSRVQFYCLDARRYRSIIDREMARSDEPEPRTQVTSSIVAASARASSRLSLGHRRLSDSKSYSNPRTKIPRTGQLFPRWARLPRSWLVMQSETGVNWTQRDAPWHIEDQNFLSGLPARCSTLYSDRRIGFAASWPVSRSRIKLDIDAGASVEVEASQRILI
jgi:hypothetical protein